MSEGAFSRGKATRIFGPPEDRGPAEPRRTPPSPTEAGATPSSRGSGVHGRAYRRSRNL
jgi:hypothetical protein